MEGPTTTKLILLIGLFILNSCKSANLPTQVSEDNIPQYVGNGSAHKATFAAG